MAEMAAQWVTAGLFMAVIMLSFRDLTRPIEAQKQVKDIPMPKLSKFTGPTLKFMYCYS